MFGELAPKVLDNLYLKLDFSLENSYPISTMQMSLRMVDLFLPGMKSHTHPADFLKHTYHVLRQDASLKICFTNACVYVCMSMISLKQGRGQMSKTLIEGVGQHHMSKVTDVEESAFSECFLLNFVFFLYF